MIDSQKITEPVKVEDFIEKIKDYGPNDVVCTGHPLFRLSEKQKETFNCGTINQYLFEEIPVLVGIQKNGRYSVFYKHTKQRYMKIIIIIKVDRIEIVTIYVIEKSQLPIIK